MNLYIAGVGEIGTLAVGLNGGGAVATHGVGGKEVGIAVTAGGYDNGVCAEALKFAGNEVLGDDAACATVDHHDVFHLIAGVELHLALVHLAHQGGVGTEQKLLARLALGVERAAHLGTAEGAVGQHTAIFAGEGHALCHALVNDVVGHFGQTIDVGLAGAVVAALHGVVEQTVNAVAVVLVVLCCVDAALSCNGVCAAGLS